MGTFRGKDLSNRLLTIKVVDAPREELVNKMQELGIRVIDVRQCLQAQVCVLDS